MSLALGTRTRGTKKAVTIASASSSSAAAPSPAHRCCRPHHSHHRHQSYDPHASHHITAQHRQHITSHPSHPIPSHHITAHHITSHHITTATDVTNTKSKTPPSPTPSQPPPTPPAEDRQSPEDKEDQVCHNHSLGTPNCRELSLKTSDELPCDTHCVAFELLVTSIGRGRPRYVQQGREQENCLITLRTASCSFCSFFPFFGGASGGLTPPGALGAPHRSERVQRTPRSPTALFFLPSFLPSFLPFLPPSLPSSGPKRAAPEGVLNRVRLCVRIRTSLSLSPSLPPSLELKLLNSPLASSARVPAISTSTLWPDFSMMCPPSNGVNSPWGGRKDTAVHKALRGTCLTGQESHQEVDEGNKVFCRRPLGPRVHARRHEASTTRSSECTGWTQRKAR